jgi:aryl-alcohol dehydrogenase-like predicted oxidoreductase
MHSKASNTARYRRYAPSIASSISHCTTQRSQFMTTTLLTRDLGQTGIRASVAGFGAMHFDHIDDEATVSRLLNGVLDLGINLIDTARGYGRSEERIGRHLAHRRREFTLSTKFGYGVDGVPDWTYDCIVRGVERALRLLATEAIDVGFLHSCPLETLERGEVTQALDDCVRAGKLRFAGYSGENAALAHALADPRFAVVQASVSLVDRANVPLLAKATNQGMLIKRSLAGLAWQRAQRPSDFCEGEYWDRWQALALADMELPWPEIALRFAAHHSGGHCVLVGSQRLANIASSIEAISRGPLSPEMLARLDRAWLRADRGWPGIV